MHPYLTILCLLLVFNLQAQNIFRTACKGDLNRLDSMLAEASIDTLDNKGRSLMHWVAACKQKGVFDYLVDKGIRLNTEDRYGRTELHVAVQYDNVEFLDYLIALLPDPSWKSQYGASLLEIAVLNGSHELLAKLLDSGVAIDAKNERGSTALEIALRMENKVISDYLLELGADKDLAREIKMKGRYMGIQSQDTVKRLFAPNFISTEEQEFGSVFNTDGTEFYFAVDIGPRYEIRFSELKSGEWTKPKTILSDDVYGYNDPFLSNDEQRLYFISNRALDGVGDKKDIDVWYVERTDSTWSAPINAGEAINTKGDEYYISFTDDGTMYFASDGHTRKDTSRKDHDIYYSQMLNGVFHKPVALPATINTEGYEADVFVAPDESYLIFCSDRKGGYGRGDLYISFKNADGAWTEAKNMGDRVNSENYEYCPFVSKDGRHLFFTSNQDVYWIDTNVIELLRGK